ncbi:DUF6314 family protein [Sinisalibacter lacisalsi]|uniref:DUF6314 domain-containing protein n=1 Tax=Sinisalibacter lacisalsi TaxID=1526570 RepID=A0ABQ1QPA3_9RHOB|nr:DUF6314 family protein [Sinisalibacter lacisalsi]GGD34895.1 hypothetical protein GCM10011358_18710 [Sinisalibacter lacisalsi]
MPQLDDFTGRWRIARRIEDAWMDTTGLFEGVARFTPDAEGLLYSEVGELRLPQEPPMAARRKLLWRQDGAGIAVLFEDGRPFHRIDPAARVVQDWHDCDPDAYDVTYNFTRWPHWRMIWKVCGPRKDYVSISDFRPA